MEVNNVSDGPETHKMVEFLCEIGKLKATPRAGWVIRKIPNPEMVAGHMYRMAIMANFSLRSTNESKLDINRVSKLCLVHDIAECIVGDITPHDGIPVDEKHRREREAISHLARLLPLESADELSKLYLEYENQETMEAKTTKDLDRFDMILQAFQYEKAEYERIGSVPNLNEFFSHEKILSKFLNVQIKLLVDDLMAQRAEFKARVNLNSE